MTLNEALAKGNSILFYAEVDTPALDCSILLAQSLGVSREKLYASLNDEIDEDSFASYKKLLDKRCSGHPVSYLIKKKEFYGLDFFVDERVLVPRPDTETVIEIVMGLVKEDEEIRSILDVCTGSGCIAITLSKLLPFLDVAASDISAGALEVFAINASRHLSSVMRTFLSDLLDGVEGSFDCIVSNPPYLSQEEVNGMKKIGWPEPKIALAGGERGFEITERLVTQAKRNLKRPGWLVLESAPGHMGPLASHLYACGYEDIRVAADLRGQKRVISGRLA